MEFQYFTKEKNLKFSLAVAEALREKAKESKYAYLVSVAEQLEKDIATNLNRAMRLAGRVNIAHSLNVNY